MLRLIVIALVLLAVTWALRNRRRRRRATRDARRFERLASLQSLRLWARLPDELRDTLVARVEDFIERVPFTGAGGLTVDDSMRVRIAAQCCLVTLGHEDTGVVTEGYEALSGQAIESDRIVLSWRDVLEGDAHDDGYNVVIHEVTHFLEHANPGGDQAARAALEAAREELGRALDRGETPLIDPYGAEDTAEFLAVAAETFFERPRELRARHPTLYVLLRESFRLDPAEWPNPTQ